MRAIAIALLVACGTPASSKKLRLGSGSASLKLDAGCASGCAQAIDAAVANPPRVYPKIAFDGNPQTDIASPPCAPGGMCATGVTLPLASSPVGAIAIDSPQTFQNVVWSTAPTADGTGTWLSVSGINTSSSSARLTGLLEFTSP